MQVTKFKKTSAAIVAVPLAASLLLAGCGGDGKPAATPTSVGPSATATPAPPTAAPSPTVTPAAATDPNIPAAARAHTPAGAEAFVRYFYSQLNVAWTVPRSGLLSPLCQTTSKACSGLEEDAVRLVTKGHHYDGNPVTVQFVGALYSPGPNKRDVLAKVVQEPRSEIDGAGKIYVTDKRREMRIYFELLYTGDAWSVVSSKIMK